MCSRKKQVSTADELSSCHHIVPQKEHIHLGAQKTIDSFWGPSDRLYSLVCNGAPSFQPAFAALTPVSSLAADTTSILWLRARFSESARATGKAEVRRFTSNCKSRSL